MDVSSGHARVADLAFQVYKRPLHPEWFTIRGHRRFTQAGWDVDVRIIEGGHAIFWSCGPARVAEILNGSEGQLPCGGLLFASPIRQERSTKLRPATSVEYQACFSAERLDAQVFAYLCEEIRLDARREGLLHHFKPTSRLNPSPLSRVDIEPSASRLVIQTFHTFPDERVIVRTQSLFEFRTIPR